jgi:AraC-like DNA-binding protein
MVVGMTGSASLLCRHGAGAYDSPHHFGIELVRDGKLPLAQIAAATGFADQSHLSRWVKRVYGVSMTQLTSRRS